MWSIDFDDEPEHMGDSDPFRGIAFPRDLLERHGARLLDPTAAPLAPDEPVPGSTVYRSDVLLVPVQALRPRGGQLPDDPHRWISGTLARIGLTFEVPDLDGMDDDGARWRPVVLRVHSKAQGVVPIDAWTALQELRRNLPPFDPTGSGNPAPEDPDEETDRRRRYGRQIGLDHLLVGSAYSGIGAAADIGGEPATDGHGVPGHQITTAQPDYGARHPVQLVLNRPPRRDMATFARVAGARRPTICLIDSGILDHPWLDYSEKAGDDTFVVVSPAAQERILTGLAADDKGQGRRPVAKISGYLDSPAPLEPLLGLANAQVGHCVFEAGLIYQVVPDARVLAIRAMHPDGVVRESALLIALEYVLEQVRAAQADRDDGLFVDVVSLSCGYFIETEDDRRYTIQLRKKLLELRARGVVVVAAAGNFATTRAMQPAGAASIPVTPGPVAPMLAVGAKNPDGSIAIFSNEGKAIRYHAPGVALVSTFPPVVRGAQAPVLEIPASEAAGKGRPARTSFDPDNYASGFAAWSGTSFSAPLVAATLARRLVEEAGEQLGMDPQAPGLADVTPGTAVDRAIRAASWLHAGSTAPGP